MREIKFRAWDKKEENYVYFDALDGIYRECDETYRQLMEVVGNSNEQS
jgi:hypothetical protein